MKHCVDRKKAAITHFTKEQCQAHAPKQARPYTHTQDKLCQIKNLLLDKHPYFCQTANT